MIIFLLFIYLIPTIIAVCRKHSNMGAIVALNILTGWTFLGWVASLVWSFTDNVRRVEVIGMQTIQAPTYASLMNPALTGGFGGARSLIPTPERFLPHIQPQPHVQPYIPLERCCRIRQHAGSRMWYIESAVNPLYTWTGSGWDQSGAYTQTYAFPEGAQAEAQVRGFQVIA